MKYLIMFISTYVFAITETQVYSIAKQFTNYPSTIVAIAKTESSLGRDVLGDDGKSLGLMQIQVPTARFIAEKDKSLAWLLRLKKKQLETVLLRSDETSIHIASSLFEYYRKRYGYFEAISRYNGGRKNYIYYNRVMKRMNK